MSDNDKYRQEYWLQYIIHRFGIAYGWTKSQIDEIYPEESIVLLRLITLDDKDDKVKVQLAKYEEYLQLIKIQHSDNVKRVFGQYLRDMQKIADGLKTRNNEGAGNSKDLSNELPQVGRMRELKTFLKENPLRGSVGGNQNGGRNKTN